MSEPLHDYNYYIQQIATTVRSIKDVEKQQWELNEREDKLKNRLHKLTELRNQCTPAEGSRVHRFVDKLVDGFMTHRRSIDCDVTRDEVLHFAQGIIDYKQSYVDWGWNVAPGHKWKAILLQYKCTHDSTNLHDHGPGHVHELHYPYDETAQKWAEDHRLSFSPERIAKAPEFASFDKKTGTYAYPDTNWEGRACTYNINAVDYILFFAFPNQLEA